MSRSLASLPRRWRLPRGCSGVPLEGALVFSGVRSSAAAVVHVVLLFAELLSSGAAKDPAKYCFATLSVWGLSIDYNRCKYWPYIESMDLSHALQVLEYIGSMDHTITHTLALTHIFQNFASNFVGVLPKNNTFQKI